MILVSIDPGIRGAIAWAKIQGDDRKAIVPDCEVVAPKAADLQQYSDCLASTLRAIAAMGQIRLVTEDVHTLPKDGKASAFSFGESVGVIRGAASVLEIDTVRVSPQAWKTDILSSVTAEDVERAKMVWPKAKFDSRKIRAIAFCIKRFPDISLVPPGCRTPNDNLADALCLWEYGLRRL